MVTKQKNNPNNVIPIRQELSNSSKSQLVLFFAYFEWQNDGVVIKKSIRELVSITNDELIHYFYNWLSKVQDEIIEQYEPDELCLVNCQVIKE